MADYDDKLLGPIFPTRSGTAQGGATERQMLDSTQGAAGIRTKIKMNPDGSQTRLRTRAGMPEFVTIDAESGGGDEVFHGGLAGEIYSAGAASGKPSIYKLSPAIVTPGKKAPGEVEAYALTIPGGGGYSYRKDGTVKVVWASGNSKVSSDLHEWKKVSRKSIQPSDDYFYIPFAFNGNKFIASDTAIISGDGSTVFSYIRPWRTVNINTGPRQYDKLYPLVSYDQTKAILQSSDSQLFLDAVYGTPTEMTRLYDGIVFDSLTETTTPFSGRFFTGIPVGPSIINESNTDGESLSRSYPCVAHRPWWDSLNPDGTGKPDPWPVIVETISGSADTITPAREDSHSTEDYSYNGSQEFTKTVFGDSVVGAEYKISALSNKTSNVIQQYFENALGNQHFSSDYSFNPYYIRLGQSMENCSIHTSESVDIKTSIKIGEDVYPIFSAIGSTKCDGFKFNHVAKEGIHPVYGLYWPGDPYYDGGSLWPALEDACGYSVSEMQTWSGPGLGGGWTADITKSNTESDRTEHIELEAIGCYHLAADATLGFNAYLEFSFKYSVDLNSATFDTKWKWKIPRTLAPITIYAEVKLIVKHKGVASEKALFVGSLTKRPPVTTVPYGNPYYFVWLRYGGAAIRAQLAQNEADIIWVHKLPNTTPQPSWFNSLDTIVRQQQTSPYLAGLSASEIAQAQANNSRFPTPGVDLIFSRRINMREAGADWLFKAYGIDEPTTTGGRAYGYSDDLYSLICDKTWRFEYDSANGLNFWTDAVSQSVGDSETDKYANCFRV